MLGRTGKLFKLKALFPRSGIWAPSWAWLSFEPALGMWIQLDKRPSPAAAVMYPLYCRNVQEIIMLISLIISVIKSVWRFVSIYELVGIRSLFFFLSQALQDLLGSGRSLSVHSQVTCFPFWVLILEKLSSEFLHCSPRWIIAHHSHPNA